MDRGGALLCFPHTVHDPICRYLSRLKGTPIPWHVGTVMDTNTIDSCEDVYLLHVYNSPPLEWLDIFSG